MTKRIFILLLVCSFSVDSYAEVRFGFLNPSNWGRGGGDAAEQAGRNGDAPSPNGNQADQGDGLARTDVGTRTEIVRLDDITRRVEANPNITGMDETAFDIDAIIGRTKKAAPINVAPAGSGKSALIEYMQYLIEQGSSTVFNMRNKELLYLDVNRLVGGTELQGSLQARFSAIVQEISDPANSNKILVIDELEEVLKDEKHGLAFIENLKTYMAGDMNGAKLIFNITPPAYEKLMKDPQLIRRMLPVFRNPPPDATVRNILHVLAKDSETKTGVKLTDEQLEKIFRLSKMHPNLANPDVAITILDDTINMVLKDMNSGSRAITSLRTNISNYQQALNALRRSREQGAMRIFGPFFSYKEKRYEDLISRAQGVLRSYDESRVATEQLREQLNDLVTRRAEANALTRANRANENFGDVNPLTAVEELDEQIEDLSRQIISYDPMLTGLEPSTSHIQLAAEINLGGVSARQIEDSINGGVGTDTLVTRAMINDPRLERNKVVVRSIVERILTRRRFRVGQQQLPAFLIIDPFGSQQADNIVNAITREMYEQNSSYRISGPEITERFSLNNHIGSDSGTIGNDRVGALFRSANDTNGFMTLLATRIDRATNHLTDFLQELISTGRRQSNHGEQVDFTSTSVFMTTSHADLRLTGEALSQYNEINDPNLRQEFLRNFVKENFTGLSASELAPGHRLEDDLLRNVNIIYLDEGTDISSDILIANELKSADFRNAIEDMELGLQFDESVIAFLADRMRQLGGGSDVRQVIEGDLLIEINRAFENGEVMPGDLAMIGHNGSEFVYQRADWPDETIRERLLAEHRVQYGTARLLEGPDQEAARESGATSVEGLLQEMSEIR